MAAGVGDSSGDVTATGMLSDDESAESSETASSFLRGTVTLPMVGTLRRKDALAAALGGYLGFTNASLLLGLPPFMGAVAGAGAGYMLCQQVF